MTDRPADEIRTAWEDVSERLTVWGRLVAERYRTSETTETTTETRDRSLEDSARDLGDQLNRAFTALGDTFRDEQAKDELRGAMKAFGDAVSVTVNETADQIRRRVGSTPQDGNRDGSGSSTNGTARDDEMPPPPTSA